MANYVCQDSTLTFDANSDENHDDSHCYITYHSSDEFLASLKFTSLFSVDKWVLREGASEPVFRGRVTRCLAFDIHLDRHQLFDSQLLMGILNDKFYFWPLAQCRVNILIRLAMRKAREAYKCMPSSCNKIDIHFPMSIVHRHLYNERRAIDLAIQRSEAEEKRYMIPAAESAIESALKRVEVGTDSAGNKCSICFVKMKGGCDCEAAVAIPCSHVFHENCIRQWLRTSHYCPLCRYELPTD